MCIHGKKNVPYAFLKWGCTGALLFCACGQQERQRQVVHPDASVWEEARRRDVDFRAVGQEPGWLLEIHERDFIRFAYDYARRETIAHASMPETDEEAGERVYRTTADGDSLIVRIVTEPCTDTMSGESFEARVSVTYDDTTYDGCGRSLRRSQEAPASPSR